MPYATSKYFGTLEFEASDLFNFRLGLPGFEEEREFVAVSIPGQEPLMYLQSVKTPDLCLITLPVRVCQQDYVLELTAAERTQIELPAGADLRIGVDVACQAILTLNEMSEPTANLAAPLVLNLSSRLGVQAFQADFDYSFQHPLPATAEAVAACS